LDSEPAIWVDSLTKTYRSGNAQVRAFSNLSFKVNRGSRLAVIGESGAGKSTLLHLLGALDRPSSGRILYGDLELTGLGEQSLADFRNRQIGFVWQNPSLLPEFSAVENVMMPLLIRGIHPGEAFQTSLGRLQEVGLADRAGHRAGELSGGEQQRVAIARALVGEPQVLLADEPTGSLDYKTAEAITNLLLASHTANGLTSVFVTHNLEFAKRCDQVLELKKGALHLSPVLEMQEPGVVVQDATRLDGGTHV
jgi:lipoprotein-releasing system ATP-binding protein